MSIFPVSAIPSASVDYEIDNSLRFNDDDSAYLSRTPSSAGNRKTWTWSGWVKRGNLGTNQSIFRVNGTGDTGRTDLWFDSSTNTLYLAGSSTYFRITSQLFRDSSAWGHLIVAFDTTQSTANDRCKLYWNGTQITDFSTNNAFSLNTDYGVNQSSISWDIAKGYGYLDGYLAEVNFIDGQALTPSSFGEFGDYGEWNAIEYTGTYGTNGFHLDFSNDSAIVAHGDTHHSTTQSKFGVSSLYFDGNGDYISLPDRVEWDFGTSNFTQEMWIHPTGMPSSGYTKLMWTSVQLALYSNGSMYCWAGGSEGGSSSGVVSTGSWQHIALVKNSGTLKVYVNGSQVISFGAGAIGDHGERSFFDISGDYYTGYAEEIRISSNARYTSAFTPPSSPFTTDSNTLTLIQSEDTNGVLIGHIGSDMSGNANNWTPNNLASTDQMVDTPTNNFCTWNPLDKLSTPTLSEGNLKANNNPAGEEIRGTMTISSGKWYWEYTPTVHTQAMVGITSSDSTHTGIVAAADAYWYYQVAGSFYGQSVGVSYGTLWTDLSSVIGVALDLDNNTISFYKNNVPANASGTNDRTTHPVITNEVITVLPGSYVPSFISASGSCTGVANFGQDSSFAGDKTAQGNQDSNEIGDFYYTPPTGFLALCTANLPAPTVIPSEHFNTVLYSGTGSAGLAITGVGFQPDFTWLKRRSLASNHHLYTSVSGVGNFLQSSTDTAESTTADGLSSFDVDGFTIDATDATNPAENSSGHTFVSWNWKAGGSGTAVAESGTGDGSINAHTYSANTDAGFSIVKYEGRGDEVTAGFHTKVGHGLSVAPEMVIIKSRDNARGWAVMTDGISYAGVPYANVHLRLDTTASTSAALYVTSIAPDSTHFYVGDDAIVNAVSENYIAYCFHSVEGYSKVSSYTGNGSADGPFVHTGFRPAYVMIKKTDVGNTYTSWMILDSERQVYNPTDHTKNLWANQDFPEGKRGNGAASGTFLEVDFTSNGFKIRGASNSETNTSNGKYIYLAFAESPFKHTNAR